MDPISTDPTAVGGDSLHSEPPASATAPSLEFLFSHLAGTVQEVFWVSPADLSALVYASPGFERVWGLPWQQAPQPPAAVIGAAHPEDLARVLREIRSLQDAPRDIEYRILRPDGSLRWIRNRVRMVPG